MGVTIMNRSCLHSINASAGTFLHGNDDQPEGLGRQGRGPTLAELALRLMSVKAYSTDPMLHAFEDVVCCW